MFAAVEFWCKIFSPCLIISVDIKILFYVKYKHGRGRRGGAALILQCKCLTVSVCMSCRRFDVLIVRHLLVEKLSSELWLCKVSPVLSWKWTVKVRTAPSGMADTVSLLDVCITGLVLRRRYDTVTTLNNKTQTLLIQNDYQNIQLRTTVNY